MSVINISCYKFVTLEDREALKSGLTARCLDLGLKGTILLAPEIPYEVLVQVMDTVRVYEIPGGAWARAELFPNIAVGDAPT